MTGFCFRRALGVDCPNVRNALRVLIICNGARRYARWVTLLKNFICKRVSPFDVRKSVLHHTIQIIQPTRHNTFTSLLLDVYAWLNMFRASPRPSSGAYNCTRSLWFYRWREAAGALLVVVWLTTTNNVPAASFQR